MSRFGDSHGCTPVAERRHLIAPDFSPGSSSTDHSQVPAERHPRFNPSTAANFNRERREINEKGCAWGFAYFVNFAAIYNRERREINETIGCAWGFAYFVNFAVFTYKSGKFCDYSLDSQMPMKLCFKSWRIFRINHCMNIKWEWNRSVAKLFYALQWHEPS